MSEAVRTPDAPLVVCDASVFYSIVMTDLLLSLGVAELIRPRWTQQIHDEWMRNLRTNRPDLDPAKIERRRQQMDAAIDDCLIAGKEEVVEKSKNDMMELFDCNDIGELKDTLGVRWNTTETRQQ